MGNLNTVIGKNINEIDKTLDFGTSYPVVDTNTLKVIAIVDGNSPEDFNGGKWETAELIGGEVVRGEHYSQFAVATE